MAHHPPHQLVVDDDDDDESNVFVADQGVPTSGKVSADKYFGDDGDDGDDDDVIGEGSRYHIVNGQRYPRVPISKLLGENVIVVKDISKGTLCNA
jgi:hypothetical protein